jgi:hypothetical protein
VRLADAAQPASLLVIVALLAAVPGVVTSIRSVPGNLHANSPTDPPLPLLGYVEPGAVNLQEITNLEKIINAYTPPGAPVFDFANEPGLIYFLFNRTPGSRYFHVEEAETPLAQSQVIQELSRSRPRLVTFTDYDFGLPIVDGIVGEVRNYEVSQYLLDNYVPLADDDGQLVMIRNDLAKTAPSVSSLHLPGVVKGYRGSYFSSFSCAFGYIPNFLALPADSSTPVPIPLSGGNQVNTEITGWAVDDRLHQPAKLVVAVNDGHVIATARPDIYRRDIQDFFGQQVGWDAADAARVANSGFELDFARRPLEPVQVYAINADGTATRILPAPPPAAALGHGLRVQPHSTVPIDLSGATHQIESSPWLNGWLNTFSSVAQRIYVLRIAPSVVLSGFTRLVIAAHGALGDARFVLADIPGDMGREITFSSLSRAGDALTLPVGSCLEWHGYSGTLKLIEVGGAARVDSIDLLH